MRSSFFFMMFISFAVRSTDPHNHGSKTTICWFWWTCNESKQHYITGYIMTLCNLQIHWYILFSFLVFSCSTACLSLLMKPAKWMCQTDPPNKSAKMSCHGNMPDPSANMTRQIYLPEIPPSPLKIPRQNMARQPSPPPPPQLRQRRRRGGQGVDPARLCTLNRYFYFSHEWLHILV